MSDETRLPDGPDIALRALAEALARAYSNPVLKGEEALYGESRVSASISEALFWIAALDDHLQQAKANYFGIRASAQGGRTVGGLIYVRNLVGHGLHTATAARYELAPLRHVEDSNDVTESPEEGRTGGYVLSTGGRPPISANFRWAPLATLPPPRRPEAAGRDRMYDAEVARRPLLEPLRVAAAWLKQTA